MTETPDNRENVLLQQYTAYLEDVGNIGQRHENARRFYLSVVSALLVFLSLAGDNGPFVSVKSAVQLAAGLSGLSICILWFVHMLSFGALFRAKFKTLRLMEENLAFPIFAREWDLLKDNRRYTALTFVDSLMPVVFAFIYLATLFLK